MTTGAVAEKTAGWQGMETGFAAFDKKGRLREINQILAGSRSFAFGSKTEDVLPQLVERYSRIDSIKPPFDSGFLDRVADAWGHPGASIEVELKRFGWRLLSNCRHEDGSVTYFSTDISALKSRSLESDQSEAEAATVATGLPDPEKLRAQELLHDAIQSVKEGIALWDNNFRLVTCNQAYADYTGVSMDQYKPGVFYDDMALTSARDGKFVSAVGREEEFAAGIINMRHTFTKDVETQLKDGRWVNCSCYRTDLGGVLFTLFDVTARKQAHERIMDTLNDALQSVSEGFSLWDEDGRFVTCNQAYRDLLLDKAHILKSGATFDDLSREIMGSGFFNTPPGRADNWVAETLEANDGFVKDLEIERHDGAIIAASFFPTKLGRFVLTSRDITAERRAAEAERDADMLLRKIVDACPVNFLVSRVEDGKIIYCPPPSRERFGDIESTLSFFLAPQHRTDYLDALLPTGELNDYPVQFRRADGSILHGLTSARLTDYKGEDVIVSATRDISEHLAMQAELERQREIAHQNEKMSALGELLAGVAHELNNPLSIVVGYSQMMQDKVTDPVLKRRVDRVQGAAERCAKIVKTFLAMARQRPARLEHSTLNDVLEIAWDVAGYGLRASGAEIILDLADDLPSVAVDPDQMAQVFTNLIINAEQAMEGLGDKAKLTIQTGRDTNGKTVFLKLKDNGAGMSPDIRARIFEPYFTTKNVGSGTGVGLAFCHRIVDSHGGTLTVSSRPDKGAAFKVRLPIAPAPLSAKRGSPHPDTPVAEGHVLIVDDEEGITQMLCELLTDEGFSTVAVNDASHALEMIAERSFDLILSDMKMPGMDGPGLLDAIKRDHPQMASRLVFITGDTMSEDVSDFLEACGRPYLEKPVVPGELLKLVSRMTSTQGGPK
jgi:hypothetical protein